MKREPEDRRDRAEAREWLKDFLANGSQPADLMFREGEKARFSEKTLKRAKKDLGVISKKSGFKDGSWCWILPEEGKPAVEGSLSQQVGPLHETFDKKPRYDAKLVEVGQVRDIDLLRNGVGLLQRDGEPEKNANGEYSNPQPEILVDAD
jgi:hypothetical protein